MNNEPREKLRELIVEYGRSLCDDPRRCEALLKDYCGQYKRETFVMIAALKNRVADDLLKAPAGVPQVMILARLVKRLENDLSLAETAAKWAVESWALALGVIDQPLPINDPQARIAELEAQLANMIAKLEASSSQSLAGSPMDQQKNLNLADDRWTEFETDYPDIAGPIKAKLDEITARLDAMWRAFGRYY
jgi:hypothetical protein